MDGTGFRHGFADVGEVTLHYVEAGEGETLVLLHGWPQTWFEWRHVMPELAKQYRVVAPDLRGLGDSTRPLSGYDKRTMAEDIWRLVNGHLGQERFCLVGHDWGGPTAFALAAAHPEAVRRLAILDVVIPGDGGEFSQGGRRWHHAFHLTPDLPEALVTGRERIYLTWFYRTYGYRPDAIGEAEIDEYVRTYSLPGALRAGFSLYRALPRDAADNAALLKNFKLPMPVLGLGGANAWGRGKEVEASLRRVAENVTAAVIEECGHWIPEEQPEVLLSHLLPFLAAD